MCVSSSYIVASYVLNWMEKKITSWVTQSGKHAVREPLHFFSCADIVKYKYGPSFLQLI